MLKFIDKQLNLLTMYRVVIYALLAIVANALIFSLFGIISWNFSELVFSLLVLSISAITTHYFFKTLFNAPANFESTVITVLILFFVLAPSNEVRELLGLSLAGIIAIASKYLLAWKKIHIFNPAAFAAVVVGIPLIAPAFWWIGTPSLLPVTAIVGLLVVRKIHRFDLFLSVIVTSTATALIFAATKDVELLKALRQHFLSWPIVFFTAFMVTEPLSTPPRRYQRILYGTFIGIISSLPIGVGSIYSTPELTLVVANGFSFFLGLKRRLVLELVKKEKVAKQTYEFIFKKPKGVTFLPGQYLEWVLPHKNADDRGIKRFFTISSAPSENEISIGVKFPKKPSSYKQALQKMKPGDVIYASQLAGDFVLPKDKEKPLVFIAGGIGVTPFASMARSLMKKNEERNAALFMTCNTPQEFAYQDLFDQAKENGVKPVYVVTDKEVKDWNGERGFIDDTMLKRHVKQIPESIYYISGPPAMVKAYKSLLVKNQVPRTHIKTDYFPGYA